MVRTTEPLELVVVATRVLVPVLWEVVLFEPPVCLWVKVVLTPVGPVLVVLLNGVPTRIS